MTYRHFRYFHSKMSHLSIILKIKREKKIDSEREKNCSETCVFMTCNSIFSLLCQRHIFVAFISCDKRKKMCWLFLLSFAIERSNSIVCTLFHNIVFFFLFLHSVHSNCRKRSFIQAIGTHRSKYERFSKANN